MYKKNRKIYVFDFTRFFLACIVLNFLARYDLQEEIFFKNKKLMEYFFRETDYDLTAPVAFTLFSIFTALQFTVATLPIAIKSIAESRVCLDRFKKFLLLPEYEKKFEDERSDSEMYSIVFEDFNAAREIELKDAHDDDKEEEERLGKFLI